MKSSAGKIIPVAVVLIIAISAVSVLEYLNSGSQDDSAGVSLPSDLLIIKDKTEREIGFLFDEAGTASEKIASKGSNAAKSVVSDAYNNTGYAVSYGFLSSNGVLEAVYPEEYSASEGLLIGNTEPARTILEKRDPYMAGAFQAVEGFYAIELSYPVITGGGEYLGAVLCMAEPYELLSDIITPYENETGVSVTVMQTDGLILYDRDTAQAGKNLFNDPYFTPYASLRNFGHTICSKKSGYGTYTFYDPSSDSEKSVKKQAYWDTVENPGSEWRIILFKSAVSAVSE